jgi:hypothetical protein
MKYYTKTDLEGILITGFSKELKEIPEINYTDMLIESPDSEFILDTADVFRQGICQLFAYALQEEFGYGVYRIRVGSSFHIFCKSADGLTYIDVRGKTTDFYSFISGSDVPTIPFDISEPYSFEPDDFSGDYYDIGLAFARVLIKSDIERYRI